MSPPHALGKSFTSAAASLRTPLCASPATSIPIPNSGSTCKTSTIWKLPGVRTPPPKSNATSTPPPQPLPDRSGSPSLLISPAAPQLNRLANLGNALEERNACTQQRDSMGCGSGLPFALPVLRDRELDDRVGRPLPKEALVLGASRRRPVWRRGLQVSSLRPPALLLVASPHSRLRLPRGTSHVLFLDLAAARTLL